MKVVEEVKRLEAELAGARESAKDQLLAKAKELVDALFEIGFAYDLVEQTSEPSAAKTSRTCSICKKSGHTKSKCPALRTASETNNVGAKASASA